MDQKSLTTLDEVRAGHWENFVLQIRQGKQKTRDGICEIAEALNGIKNEELYRDQGCETFDQCVEKCLEMTRMTAWNIMAAANTIVTLEAAGLNIPDTQEALLLLHKIPTKDRAKVWKQGLDYLNKENKPVTTANIKKVVEAALNQQPKGVDVDLDLDDSASPSAELRSEPAAQPAVSAPRFTEEGERALERIGRLAGKVMYNGILDGSVHISERDLIRWADENDSMVKNLAYYIDHGWSFRKALAYEESAINEETTLGHLIDYTTAHEGKYEFELQRYNEEWKFKVERKFVHETAET